MSYPINNFSELYQQFSDRKLLQIIQEEKDYLPEAIVAARAELDNRQLTEEEIAALKDEITNITSKKINWDWMNSSLVTRLKSWLGKIDIGRKLGILTALGLSFWMLFWGFQNGDFRYLSYILTNGGYKFNWHEAYLLLPYLAFAAAVPLLLIRKKAGWITGTLLASTFTMFLFWEALMSVITPAFFPSKFLYSTSSYILINIVLRWVAFVTVAGIPILLHLRWVREYYQVESYWVILVNWLALTWVLFYNLWF